MAEVHILTPEGKKQLEEKLNFYKTVKRREVAKKIGAAREFGDLSENSEYDAAKEEQALVEAEISEMGRHSFVMPSCFWFTKKQRCYRHRLNRDTL